jgi:alpha-mannosidase
VSAYGSAAADAPWPPDGAGSEVLALQGEHVELSALRRRDGWIEARVVNLSADRRMAVLRGGILEAREASLRGEPGAAIEVAGGAARLELGPAEIRTLQLRRHETALGRAEVLDAAGPRQSG